MNATVPKDVGEAALVFGANGFRDHVRNNTHPFKSKETKKTEKRELPPIIDIMDFLDKPLSKPPELIKDLLHKGTKLIFERSVQISENLGSCSSRSLRCHGATVVGI